MPRPKKFPSEHDPVQSVSAYLRRVAAIRRDWKDRKDVETSRGDVKALWYRGQGDASWGLTPSRWRQVMISVSDTGVGLPEEKVDRIFDAFFTTKPQGSGMGLAISRSIIEAHGGHLWTTANDGRGAAFHFTLPIAEEVKLPAAGS